MKQRLREKMCVAKAKAWRKGYMAILIFAP
jgi:hypothetical protein